MFLFGGLLLASGAAASERGGPDKAETTPDQRAPVMNGATREIVYHLYSLVSLLTYLNVLTVLNSITKRYFYF